MGQQQNQPQTTSIDDAFANMPSPVPEPVQPPPMQQPSVTQAQPPPMAPPEAPPTPTMAPPKEDPMDAFAHLSVGGNSTPAEAMSGPSLSMNQPPTIPDVPAASE